MNSKKIWIFDEFKENFNILQKRIWIFDEFKRKFEYLLNSKKIRIFVEFQNPQSAIQEGQFVAWYKNEELLGSGVIS